MANNQILNKNKKDFFEIHAYCTHIYINLFNFSLDFFRKSFPLKVIQSFMVVTITAYFLFDVAKHCYRFKLKIDSIFLVETDDLPTDKNVKKIKHTE